MTEGVFTEAEEIEALNVKYNVEVTVYRLSSGNYAIYDHFTNRLGLPLLFIGPWPEAEKYVIEASQRPPEPIVTPTSYKPLKPTISDL